MSKTKISIIQILKSFVQYALNESVCITIIAISLPALSSAQALSQKSFSHVNSPYDEQSPFISPDGKVLYWTVANHPDNIGGKRTQGISGIPFGPVRNGHCLCMGAIKSMTLVTMEWRASPTMETGCIY